MATVSENSHHSIDSLNVLFVGLRGHLGLILHRDPLLANSLYFLSRNVTLLVRLHRLFNYFFLILHFALQLIKCLFGFILGLLCLPECFPNLCGLLRQIIGLLRVVLVIDFDGFDQIAEQLLRRLIHQVSQSGDSRSHTCHCDAEGRKFELTRASIFYF